MSCSDIPNIDAQSVAIDKFFPARIGTRAEDLAESYRVGGLYRRGLHICKDLEERLAIHLVVLASHCALREHVMLNGDKPSDPAEYYFRDDIEKCNLPAADKDWLCRLNSI